MRGSNQVTTSDIAGTAVNNDSNTVKGNNGSSSKGERKSISPEEIAHIWAGGIVANRMGAEALAKVKSAKTTGNRAVGPGSEKVAAPESKQTMLEKEKLSPKLNVVKTSPAQRKSAAGPQLKAVVKTSPGKTMTKPKNTRKALPLVLTHKPVATSARIKPSKKAAVMKTVSEETVAKDQKERDSELDNSTVPLVDGALVKNSGGKTNKQGGSSHESNTPQLFHEAEIRQDNNVAQCKQRGPTSDNVACCTVKTRDNVMMRGSNHVTKSDIAGTVNTTSNNGKRNNGVSPEGGRESVNPEATSHIRSSGIMATRGGPEAPAKVRSAKTTGTRVIGASREKLAVPEPKQTPTKEKPPPKLNIVRKSPAQKKSAVGPQLKAVVKTSPGKKMTEAKNSSKALPLVLAKKSVATSAGIKPLKKAAAKKSGAKKIRVKKTGAEETVAKDQRKSDAEFGNSTMPLVDGALAKSFGGKKNKQGGSPHKTNTHLLFHETETREDSTLLNMAPVNTCFDRCPVETRDTQDANEQLGGSPAEEGGGDDRLMQLLYGAPAETANEPESSNEREGYPSSKKLHHPKEEPGVAVTANDPENSHPRQGSPFNKTPYHLEEGSGATLLFEEYRRKSATRAASLEALGLRTKEHLALLLKSDDRPSGSIAKV